IESGQNKLAGKKLYFMPAATVDFYSRVVSEKADLGNPTDDATAVTIPANGAFELALGLGNAIEFYGKLYDTIYIGSNGTIGFGGAGDNSTLENHFRMPEVSLLPGMSL